MKTRTSLTVYSREYQFLSKMIKAANIKRDPLIASNLERALDLLDEIRVNSEVDKLLISQDIYWFMTKKEKINVILPKELVDRMNISCKEKNIPRSFFFNTFIEHINLTTWNSLFMLANPTKFIERTYFEWLDVAKGNSSALQDFHEFVIKNNKENQGGLPWDYDYAPYLRGYLPTLYTKALNLSKEDERKLKKNQFKGDEGDFSKMLGF